MPRGSRSESQTNVSLSLPKALLKEINELAKKDQRSRSNWIVKVLTDHIERIKAEQASADQHTEKTHVQQKLQRPAA